MGILDLFIKVEDVPEKSAPAPAGPVTSPAQSIGQEDADIKQQLADALEKANQEGYDYFEFARSVDNQAKLIPSEALRFQSTFAVATSMGLSADKLLASAEHYLNVLKKKEDEFNKALIQHQGTAVTTKEEAIKKIDADMQAKAEQIQKITVEINGLQQQKTDMINEISTAKSDLERVKNNFYATLKIFTGRITSDIEKMKSYLTGGA